MRKIGRETAWFIDEQPDLSQMYDKDTFDKEKQTEDIIQAIAATENFLFVARLSGTIQKFTLPQVALETKLFLKTRPNFISVNSTATRLGVIDLNGTLNILEVNNQGGNLLEFEKKDCWNVMWSEDNPLHFCFMERSRLYTVKGVEADEPVTTEAFICCFSNLKVTCAMLDEIIKAEGNMKSSEIIIEFETKLLKEVKDMI